MRLPKPAKTSSATAATTLRLPRSAHRASGTAHSSCDTCAMKATAPERRVGHVERGLEVLPDEADAVAERARDQRGGGQQHQRCVAGRVQDPDQRRGLALARSGHHGEVGDHLGIADLRHGLPQQIVGYGKVEQRVVGHWPGTLSLTPVSGRVDALGSASGGA